MIGSNGSDLSIDLVSSKSVEIPDIFRRPDLVAQEQVTISESHWIADVSISYVMVHRYQC